MDGKNLVGRKGTPSNPVRIAVFFSGSGTGMNALLRHQKENDCIHKSVVCVTDREGVGGIEIARAHGIPIIQEPVNRQLPVEERRREHELRIIKQLEQYDIELIVLSGYMRLLSSAFVEQFNPRIINIHPSLLPAFPGADAHTDVLASGVNVSGCTVHVVDAGMDTGTILAQRRVPVFDTDTRTELAKRIQVEEHRLYPSVIDLICSGHQFVLDD
jgi:formyltetrahydrofolate-dependent phosphoribosylglycinamide formyltransferase